MTKNQSIKDRLLIFIAHLGIGQARFEKACNLSNGYINNSKGNFGAAKIDDILKTYPQLNRDWLMSGEGEMLKKTDIKGNNNIVQTGIVHGNNTQGNNTILTESDKERLLNILEMNSKSLLIKDEQIDKFQKQIDRLLTLLEKRI